MAGRIPRLSSTVKRTLARLGVDQRSARYRALFTTITSLSHAAYLPGAADFETRFHPGYVHVRRVRGFNLWILYRFDGMFVDVMTVHDEPPPPVDRE
ncbi:hypothetical protein BH09MYX1_BH09MYX1_09430 [soil metagenome]